MNTAKATVLFFLAVFFMNTQLDAQIAAFNREKEKLYILIEGNPDDKDFRYHENEAKKLNEELQQKLFIGLKKRFDIVYKEDSADKTLKVVTSFHYYKGDKSFRIFSCTVNLIDHKNNRLTPQINFYDRSDLDRIIVNYTLDNSPLIGRIISITQNEVLLDIGKKHGIDIGQRMGVYSLDPDAIAFVEVTSLDNNTSIAKLVSGKPEIGMTVQEINYRLKNFPKVSVVIGQTVSVKKNPLYEENTGKIFKNVQSAITINIDYLSYHYMSHYMSLGASIVLVDDVFRIFYFNFEIAKNIELIPESLELYVGVKAGLGRLLFRKYYNTEKQKISQTRGEATYIFKVFSGLRYFISEHMALTADIGYSNFSFSKDDLDVSNDQLQFTDVEVGGFAPRFGIDIIF